LHDEKYGVKRVVELDFIGKMKDSIRYSNEIHVNKQVFKNLELFLEDKTTGDFLFDRLTVSLFKKHWNMFCVNLKIQVNFRRLSV